MIEIRIGDEPPVEFHTAHAAAILLLSHCSMVELRDIERRQFAVLRTERVRETLDSDTVEMVPISDFAMERQKQS